MYCPGCGKEGETLSPYGSKARAPESLHCPHCGRSWEIDAVREWDVPWHELRDLLRAKEESGPDEFYSETSCRVGGWTVNIFWDPGFGYGGWDYIDSVAYDGETYDYDEIPRSLRHWSPHRERPWMMWIPEGWTEPNVVSMSDAIGAFGAISEAVKDQLLDKLKGR